MPIDEFTQLAHGVLDDGAIDLEAEVSSLPERIDGRKHPESVRAYALRLWTFEAAQNPRKVVHLMKERADYDVSEATIRNWSLREEWDTKVEGLHQAFAFSQAATIKAGVAIGAVEGVNALRRIVNDEEAQETAVVKAAMQLIAMAGYAPDKNAGSINLAVNIGRDRMSQLSDHELEDMASSYHHDGHEEAPPFDVPYTEARLSRRPSHRER